jgi:hypothetical protein
MEITTLLEYSERSQLTIPNLQSNIHITPLTFDVVSIEFFGVTPFQDAAFTTIFAAMQTLPSL